MSFAPLLGENPFVFYTGTVSSQTAIPFTVTLDSRTFAIDMRNYRRSSLATLRDTVIGTGQADDSLFNTDGAWWRYKHDWKSGAGQNVMDLGDNRVPTQFFQSVGVNPWTESELTLHRATASSTTTVNGSSIGLVATASYLYAYDSNDLYRTSDLTTWTQITGWTGTLNNCATDGIDLFVATSDRLWKVTPASTVASSLVNAAHAGVWYAGNRLLAVDAGATNQLHSVSSSGAKTAVMTHFQPSFTYTSVFAIGSKLYAGGYAGLRSELYGFTVNSSGNLVVGAEVVSFSVGEILNFALSHIGFVILCTNKGIRLASVSADSTLTYGPLIEEPGSVTHAVAEGRYVWFTWNNIDTGLTGTGRLDLAQFTQPMTPAFATDVYASGSSCSAVARFSNQTVFAVPTTGVFKESTTTYVTSGYVTSGDIYFGTVEDKSITDVRASFEPLAAGEGVTMYVYDDQDEILNQAGSTVVNARDINVDLDGERADYFKVKVVLTGDGTTTPTFQRWRIRAFPVVPPVEQFVVPLMLYSKTVINDAGGQMMSMDVDESNVFLQEVWETKRPVTYVEGSTVHRVRLEAYEYVPNEWSDTHNGFEGVMTVRLVSI